MVNIAENKKFGGCSLQRFSCDFFLVRSTLGDFILFTAHPIILWQDQLSFLSAFLFSSVSNTSSGFKKKILIQ